MVIGASSGGVDALSQMVAGLPSDLYEEKEDAQSRQARVIRHILLGGDGLSRADAEEGRDSSLPIRSETAEG